MSSTREKDKITFSKSGEWLEKEGLQKFLLNNISLIVVIIAIVLLIINIVRWKQITVDTTTLWLLIIILVSPYTGQVAEITIGNLIIKKEVKSKDVKKTKSEFDKSKGKRPLITSSEVKKTTKDLIDLIRRDRVWTFNKLNEEFKKALSQLYKQVSPITIRREYASLDMYVEDLVRMGTLPKWTSKPLLEVVSYCNRIINQEKVSIEDAEIILDMGIDFLEMINLTNNAIKGSKKSIEARKERAELKKSIKEGEISFEESLSLSGEVVGKTKVKDLLISIPGIGKKTEENILEEVGINEKCTIKGLGIKQTKKLIEVVKRYERKD